MGNYQEYCGNNCINLESNMKLTERTFPEKNKTLNDYQEMLLIKALKFWRRYHKQKILTEKLKKLDEFIAIKKGKFMDLEYFEKQINYFKEMEISVNNLAKKESKLGFKNFNVNSENFENSENLLVLRKPVSLYTTGDLYFGYWTLEGEISGYGRLFTNKTANLIEGNFSASGNCTFGRYFFSNGTYYEGYLLNNEPNLQGELKIFGENLKEENIYSGLWLNSEFNGQGYQILGKYNDFIYEGNFMRNYFCGFGKLSYNNNSNNNKDINYSYEGNFENNKFEGFGSFKHFTNFIEEVNTITNKFEEYNGLWKNGLPNGKGIYIWKNGNIYEGNYEEGKKKGIGKFTFNSGNSFYEGIWSNGKPNGKGSLFLEKDLTISGIWKQGKIQKIDNIEDFEKIKKDPNLLDVPFDNEIFSYDFYVNLNQITPVNENVMEIFNDENNGKIETSKYFKIFAKGIENNILNILEENKDIKENEKIAEIAEIEKN